MITILNWNMQHKRDSWRFLWERHGDADIALLQEACTPPEDVADKLDVDPDPFRNVSGTRISRSAIVKLSDRVQVEWLRPVPLAQAQPGDFAVSHPDCISVAIVTPPNGEPFFAVSMCAGYERPHPSTGNKSWNVLDASAHRTISDLSLLIGKQLGHRIIVAGDLTLWYGFGSNAYWKRRNDTVFERMAAIGLPFVGPQYPNGRQAAPWPDWLPKDSLNVPTYYNIGSSPATATNQLDYVFASESMVDSVTVRALNGVDDWGPSDHCRVLIEVAER